MRRNEWDDIAWDEIADGKDEAINSKEGEAKAECVDKKHPHRRQSQARMVD